MCNTQNFLKGKIIKKFLKISIWILVVIIILSVSSYIIFLSSTVQTYLSQRIAAKISEETHTPVSIEGVNFSPFKSLILKGLYIEDYQKDTLVYIGKLKADIDIFNYRNKKLHINKLTLTKAFVNLYEDKDRILNIEVFIDSLSSPSTDTIVSPENIEEKSWDISVANIDINRTQFAYKTVGFKPQSYGMNYDDIYVTDLHLEARNISLAGDSINFYIKQLSCFEKSGFHLKNLNAQSWISSTQWGLKDVTVVSDHSRAKAKHLYFNYTPGNACWANFTKRMQLDFLIQSSRISFLDLAYFNELLYGFRETGYMSGHVYGTIFDLRGKNIDIIYGENTAIKGRFYMNGLPYIRDSYLEANFKELTTSIKDIEKVYIPGYSKEHFTLPEYFNNLGLLKYKGKFNGFINDFVFYGNLHTDLGDLKTDILFKPSQEDNKLTFKGDLKTYNFNLGKLIEQEKVGKITLNASLNGFTKDGAPQGIIKGNINKVDFYDYNYENLALNGFFGDSKFDGNISIHDNNLDFDFSGKVDFSQEIPTMNFTSHLTNAKLYPLHLNTDDKDSELSLTLNANLTGNSLENANGIVKISDTHYKNSNGTLQLDEIALNSSTSSNFKKVVLNSDIVDAKVEGNYAITELVSSIKNLTYYYLPAYASNNDYTKIDSTNKFKFDINFKNTELITKVLYPNLIIANGSSIKGDLNAENHNLNLHFLSNKITLNDQELDLLKVDLSTNKDELILKGRTNSFIYSEDLKIHNLSHKITAQKNKVKFDLLWNNWDSITYSGSLSAEGIVEKTKNQKNQKWSIDLLPSTIIMADSIWNLPKSKIVLDSSSYFIDNFKVERKGQFFGLNGKISENPKDSIQFEIKNISLKNLNSILQESDFGVKGVINGYVQVSDFYGERLSNSDVTINELIFNQDTIGALKVNSDWDKSEEKFNFSSSINYRNNKDLDINGFYLPKSDTLNLKIALNQFRLDLLNPYLQDNISDIVGFTNGQVNIQGKMDSLISSGSIAFDSTQFTINESKTRYKCHDSIKITSSEFQFNNFKLVDEFDNTASIFGTVSHHQFQNYKIDLAINAKNFNVLNTKAKDNEVFYGQAFVTSTTHLYGKPDDLEIEITAQTNKNTKLFVPLNTSGDIKESNFITFINLNHDQSNKEKNDYHIDLSGLKMSCDLEITPDTEIQILFDPKIGDILKAKGNGNLKLGIDTKGDFNIFGDYTIHKGSYLFTLQNVINKKFNLANGGNIKWSGDPYNASLNIDAIYNVKTSLYDLLLNTPYADNNRKVPVECKMNLSKNLENPSINFDINFPSLDQQTQNVIAGLFASKDEMNRQILSLLVLHRFYTPEYLRSSDPNFENKSSNYAVGVTASELLSNQLSNWLSQVSNDVNVGFSYRPGDNVTKDEVELALSTQIFNDKVTINGNVGTNNNKKSSNDFVGDFDVNVKLDKKGKLQMKAFTRSNEYLLYEDRRNTQGIGIFYKENFDTVSQLFKKYFKFLRAK